MFFLGHILLVGKSVIQYDMQRCFNMTIKNTSDII